MCECVCARSDYYYSHWPTHQRLLLFERAVRYLQCAISFMDFVAFNITYQLDSIRHPHLVRPLISIDDAIMIFVQYHIIIIDVVVVVFLDMVQQQPQQQQQHYQLLLLILILHIPIHK